LLSFFFLGLILGTLALSRSEALARLAVSTRVPTSQLQICVDWPSSAVPEKGRSVEDR